MTSYFLLSAQSYLRASQVLQNITFSPHGRVPLTGKLVSLYSGRHRQSGNTLLLENIGEVIFALYATFDSSRVSRRAIFAVIAARLQVLELLWSSPDRAELPCPDCSPSSREGLDKFPTQRNPKSASIRLLGQQIRA